MANYFNAARQASNQKDMIIHQLQSEVMALSNHARSYNVLREQVEKLESEIRHIEQQKMTVEEHSARTLGMAGQSTLSIADQIAQVKELLSKQTLANAEKATEIQALRQTQAYREKEIFRLETHELQDRTTTQLTLKKQYEEAVYKISTLQNERDDLISEIKQLDDRYSTLNAEQVQTGTINDNLASDVRIYREEKAQLQTEKTDWDREIEDKQDKIERREQELRRKLEPAQDEQRRKEITLDLQIKDNKTLNKGLQESIAIESAKLLQLTHETSLLDRDTHSLQSRVVQTEVHEVESLRKTLDEQNKAILALRDEKSAYEGHQRLLDEQNRKLMGELDRSVAQSEGLKDTLNKKDRVTELKERHMRAQQKQQEEQSANKSPCRFNIQNTQSTGALNLSNISPLRFRR
ncbi:hypothetical protein FGO68_gene10215 [Halteria grandinella]|uniref:Uncharacterized protein n=1 Tax=Halteria grandinella TaxID=5974 RepID=A0A8J8NAS0_HALGN|nr:hypothetical protein FGO68_gene10215 [Halteria grandinella]